MYWRLRERYFQNYLFIHIPKTGGRSIETALGCLYEHKTALQKRREVGFDVWSAKFTFTFVRNPWDKAVSHYAYLKKTGQDFLEEDNIDFRSWVRLVFVDRNPRYISKPLHFAPQTEWIMDLEGKQLVDYVGRFERFEADFAEVCRRIGVERQLPHQNSSHRRKDYRTYYDDETAQIIADVYASDLSYFGYSFDANGVLS
ncbi:sulfotransferase family protein [Rhodocaloribacter litoris]|uniref:sulfotransferase family 2 domain-containing protein n=1 Tax=Rhodocaloribacter litoris TaxID=2558931 RepID=UPI0014212BE5|nr:sulfotransferase family 2 domain-containing protein [Rhodocaloribacter litoris]QXD16175.1 sulfotransferase family protein [Rhodocaloribacter litoris]